MAESSLTFSSILSKYAPPNGSSVPASLPRSNPPPTTEPPYPRMTAVGHSRPSASTSSNNNQASSTPTGISGANIKSGMTRNSLRPDNGNAIKKRKMDNPAESRPMTKGEKETQERKKVLLEKMKLKKEKEAAMSGSLARGSSVPSKGVPQPATGTSKPPSSNQGYRAFAPAPAVSEAKNMSYKEKLAMAAKLQEEKKNLGAITHKPRAPAAKKEYLKKLEARQQTKGASGLVADGKSKSPGILERSGSAPTKKVPSKEMGKAGAPRKSANELESRRSSIAKSKSIDKARIAEAAVKRKRSPSPISWRGRNSTAPTKKPNRPRPGRGRYDEDEDEDDDWIVDDDEDEEAPRGRSYGKQYRYAESDYESDSDMEAAGLDILEEEEKSRRRAIKEDIEQEKLEKQLAAKKAALKKKAGR